jgi:predicted Zn-dependent protease
MKKFFQLICICLCLLFLTACSRNPVTGKYELNFYSDADEIKMGEEYHPELVKEYGEYKNPTLHAYVQDIVTRLGDVSHRPNLNYRVTLLDSPEINAFAIPGGRVYICRGLLAYMNSEAELAGVMGHEIGHITARHSVQRMSKSSGLNFGLGILFRDNRTALQAGQIAGTIALLSYSREDEMEADRLGIEYAHRAGFNPQGVGRLMTMFERLGGKSSELATILSTHPASEVRVKQARIEVRKLEGRSDINPDMGRNRYLEQISGLNVAPRGKPVQPLQIYTVQRNDTWAGLTTRFFNNADPRRLAWFNDCELTDPLPQRIKLGLF